MTTKTAEVWVSDLDELRLKGQQLFREHFEEVVQDPEVMPLVVDWRGYYDLENRGQLLVLAARRGKGLAGYAVTRVFPHLHSARTMVAQVMAIFVRRIYRGSGLGRRLLEGTISLAKEQGAKKFCIHAPPNSALDKVLSRWHDFEVEEILFSKAI